MVLFQCTWRPAQVKHIFKYLCPQGFPLIWRNSSPALNHGCTLPLLPSSSVLKLYLRTLPISTWTVVTHNSEEVHSHIEREKKLVLESVCVFVHSQTSHNISSSCAMQAQTSDNRETAEHWGPCGLYAINLTCAECVWLWAGRLSVQVDTCLLRICSLVSRGFKMKNVYTFDHLKQPWSIHSQSPGAHA